jgi:NADH-quinone oxidoreductase subunit C
MAMTQLLKELGDYICARNPSHVVESKLVVGELILLTKPEALIPLLTFLRDDERCQFKLLVDLCGVDYPEREQRFEVVYNLLSLRQNCRVRVKVATDEATPVPSATAVYRSAGWYEREAWDLLGIFFADHADLRRILTDYGFEGHPMRRDFPLTGYVEVRYDEEQKRVVYEKVKLTQEFRRFDFMSPWEGMLQLPGDEKAGRSPEAAAPEKKA